MLNGILFLLENQPPSRTKRPERKISSLVNIRIISTGGVIPLALICGAIRDLALYQMSMKTIINEEIFNKLAWFFFRECTLYFIVVPSFLVVITHFWNYDYVNEYIEMHFLYFLNDIIVSIFLDVIQIYVYFTLNKSHYS